VTFLGAVALGRTLVSAVNDAVDAVEWLAGKLGLAAAAETTTATEIDAAASSIDASLAGTATAAELSSAKIEAAAAATAASVTGADAEIEAANVAAGASFARVLGPLGPLAAVGYVGYGISQIQKSPSLNPKTPSASFGRRGEGGQSLTGYAAQQGKTLSGSALDQVAKSMGLHRFGGAYASGGYVDTPQLAIVGDAGPELILPTKALLAAAVSSGIGAPAMTRAEAGDLTVTLAGQHGAGDITIHPAPVVLRLDSRVVAQGVLRYTLERAARGPGSYAGGSLVTGAVGPA
jgi:hypothetical protein